jgi:DNA polymerase
MPILFLDFETYYTPEYSLKRLSVEAYCRDPRFEILVIGWHMEGWSDVGHPTDTALARLRDAVSKAGLVVCHNASFDGYILETVLGIKAKALACTRTMPRFTGLGWMSALSLGHLAETLGLGAKGDGLALSMGKRARDFTADEFDRFAAYCRNDVRLTEKLYHLLRLRCTDEAMEFMSMTLKMYTDPAIVLDPDRLRAYREEVMDRQETAQAALQNLFRFPDRDAFLKALRSPRQFSAMLRELGAEPPMKRTEASAKAHARALAESSNLIASLKAAGRAPTKAERVKAGSLLRTIGARGLTTALAKDDQGFRDLADHPNPDVALLAGLRADNNSPIALSRADTFLSIASRGPLLPIPLAAWGAHTGRYAAGTGGRDSESDRTNLQNLPKRKGDTALRQALRAPAGHVLVSGDSAQIEARVGAWLAGQTDLVETFARGGDPYVEMAEAIYHVPAETIRKGAKVDHDQRFITMRDVGKTTMLSSQYGIGAGKFSQYLLRNGLRLDPDMAAHEARAAEINRIYNNRYAAIRRFRQECGRVAASVLASPGAWMDDWTPARLKVRSGFDVGGGLSAPAIILPNSYPLVYPKLRLEENNLVYSLHKGAGRWEDKRLYGGALFNNITQGLAFAILAWQGTLIGRRMKVALNVHDEWVAVVPEAGADEAAALMSAVLRTAPPWTPGLPLGCDVRTTESFA